jgi:hypothetical protein
MIAYTSFTAPIAGILRTKPFKNGKAPEANGISHGGVSICAEKRVNRGRAALYAVRKTCIEVLSGSRDAGQSNFFFGRQHLVGLGNIL